MPPRPPKYHGVTRDRSARHAAAPWRAQIRVDSHTVVCWPVRYERPEDAARVYDVMALVLRGPDANLNFDGQPPVELLVIDIHTFLVEKGVLSLSRLRGTVPQIYTDPPLI
jgi:hypothetical protein